MACTHWSATRTGLFSLQGTQDRRKWRVGDSGFPAEIYPAPRSWGQRTFGNLTCWNEVDKGGHFAA